MSDLTTTDNEKGYDERQEVFLEALMNSGDFQNAKEIAGYPKSKSLVSIIKPISEEVTKITESWLAVNSMKAANAIISGIDDPTQLGLSNKLKAADSLLDRVGVSKKASDEIKIAEVKAVILLPPKNS